MKNVIIMAASIAFGTAQAAHAQKIEVTPTRGPAARGFQEYRFPNGLKLLLHPDPSESSVTVTSSYLVGDESERTGERGIAHLLEHLTFRGTTRHANITRELSMHAARANAVTMRQATSYYITIPPTDAGIEWAIDLEADRVRGATLKPEDLELERKIVLNEVRLGPADLAARARRAAFDIHPYGGGNEDADVAVASIDVVRDFYRRHYRPDNALLVIEGAFDETVVLAIVGRTFGAIPDVKTASSAPPVSEPAQTGERLINISDTRGPARLAVAYHIPPITHPDWPALGVLARMLTIEHGALHDALVKAGFASRVATDAPVTSEPDLLTFTAELRAGADAVKARDALTAALDNVAASIDDDAVAAGRTASADADDMDASGLAVCEAAGDWRLCVAEAARAAAVTSGDVRRVVAAYIHPSNRTVAVQTLVPDWVVVTVVAGDASMALRGVALESGSTRRGEKFVATPAGIAARAKKQNIAPGVALNTIVRRMSDESVSGRIRVVVNPEVLGSISTAAPSEFLARMFPMGTATKTAGEVSSELKRLQVDLTILSHPHPAIATADPFTLLTESTRPISGIGADLIFSTKRQHLHAALALIADIMQHPALTDSSFLQLRESQLASMNTQYMTGVPTRALFASLMSSKEGPAAAHALTGTERVRAVTALTSDDVRRFHREAFLHGHVAIGLAGDFDADSATRVVRKLFGDWNGWNTTGLGIAAARAPRSAATATRGRQDAHAGFDTVLVAPASWKKSEVLMGSVIDIAPDHPDYAALTLANRILGGSLNSRLFNAVRQNAAIGYSVSSYLRPNLADGSTDWVIQATYDVVNAEQALTAVRNALTVALRDGFTEDELAVERSAFLEGSILANGELSALARLLATSDANAYRVQQERIGTLTVADINAALRRYIRPDALTVVRGVPAKSKEIM